MLAILFAKPFAPTDWTICGPAPYQGGGLHVTPCPVKKKLSAATIIVALLSCLVCSGGVSAARGAQTPVQITIRNARQEAQHSVHCWPYWKRAGGCLRAQFEQVLLALVICAAGEFSRRDGSADLRPRAGKRHGTRQCPMRLELVADIASISSS